MAQEKRARFDKLNSFCARKKHDKNEDTVYRMGEDLCRILSEGN
jgi:hypothetical protein